MTRRTYLDRRWPDTPLFQDVAMEWCADQSRLLLELLWRACDLLLDGFYEVSLSANDEAKEETLNFLIAGKVNHCMSGDEPFWFPPQPPETARRKRGKGSSPTPDHGFVPYEYPRSIWPIEGKVLKNDGDLKAYVAEINDNFLTGRYAAFSREGAMLGYLLKGDPIRTLGQIGVRLNLPLASHPHFRDRPHRISVHLRTAITRNAAEEFQCHHLILLIPTV
jgi:hypothetical protein